MRFLRVLRWDIRYQFTYGFYFLYILMSAFYIVILLLLPGDVRRLGAALVILSDPVSLGLIFIGGIILLEKGENLHHYFSILPVKTPEYILSKSVSLSLISTLAGLVIAVAGVDGPVDYPVLTISLLAGSSVFTLLGLGIGVLARSVNHYLMLIIPVQIFLAVPPVLVVFHRTHPLLELAPGTLLLRLLYSSLGVRQAERVPLLLAAMAMWLLPAFWFAHKQYLTSMQKEGGVKS